MKLQLKKPDTESVISVESTAIQGLKYKRRENLSLEQSHELTGLVRASERHRSYAYAFDAMFVSFETEVKDESGNIVKEPPRSDYEFNGVYAIEKDFFDSLPKALIMEIAAVALTSANNPNLNEEDVKN